MEGKRESERERGGVGGREQGREGAKEGDRGREREVQSHSQYVSSLPPSLSSVPKTADEEAAGDVSMTVKTGRSL